MTPILVALLAALELSGECVQKEKLETFVQDELSLSIQAPKSSQDEAEQAPGRITDEPTDDLTLSVLCQEKTVEFVLRRGGAEERRTLSLEGLEGDLRERTLALAIAEALPALSETDDDSRDTAEPGATASLADSLNDAPLSLPEPAPGTESSPPDYDGRRPEERGWLADSEVLAGGSLRLYPSGVTLLGGSFGLRARRLGITTSLLSTIGTVEVYESAYTNLSLAVSYALLSIDAERLRGRFGAKIAGGYTSSDSVLRGYVGASAFAAADFTISRVWRARLEGEAGHAGWSTEEELRHAQGLFFGTTLALGVSSSL